MTEPNRPALSLAEKLDRLFKAVRPAKGEFSYEDVASALRGGGGPTISATYVWQLRRGVRDNPTKKHLEALAQFFGVAPSYFFDEDSARKIEAELELLTAMRDASIRELALRSAELSPDGVGAVRAMVEQIRNLEQGSGSSRRPRDKRGSVRHSRDGDTTGGPQGTKRDSQSTGDRTDS